MNWRTAIPEFRRDGLYIVGECVVAHNEAAAQAALADALTGPNVQRLLEIGYGLGLAHRRVRRDPPVEHWVVEGNEELAGACRAGTTGKPAARIMCDTWESVLDSAPPGYFDAVLFDPYPFDDEARRLEGWFPKFRFVSERAADLVVAALAEDGLLGFLNFDPDRCNVSVAEWLFGGSLAFKSVVRLEESEPEIWVMRKQIQAKDPESLKAIART